jgi:hypothetical protein
MMIDDEYLSAEIENAIGIIECAFQDAIDNNDGSDLEDEIKRGISELLADQDKVLSALEKG